MHTCFLDITLSTKHSQSEHNLFLSSIKIVVDLINIHCFVIFSKKKRNISASYSLNILSNSFWSIFTKKMNKQVLILIQANVCFSLNECLLLSFYRRIDH